MKSNKKLVALICVLLLMVGSAGATLAWLTDTTQEVTNTFTVGNIGITLTESDSEDEDEDANINSYKMVPGYTYEKDPTITVDPASEPCWVFVEVTETFESVTVEGKTYGFDEFITYGILEDWTAVEGTTNVYALKVEKPAEADPLKVIFNDKNENNKKEDSEEVDVVGIKDTVTKKMMDKVTSANYPKLTFKAYAVQLMKNNTTPFTAKEAWEQL